MKLAKKVLAALMAIAMIAGLSAMAFAASPTIALVPTVAGSEVAVAVVLKDAIGAKSWDINVTYDASVLAFSYAEDGADVAQVAKTKGNSITTDYNGDTAGLVKTSGYFKTTLTDAATFVADSKKASDPANVNVDACEVIVLFFDVKDDKAETTDFAIEVTAQSGVEFAGQGCTATLKKVDPTQPSSSETQTQPQPGTTEPTSGTDKPTTEKTTDNGVPCKPHGKGGKGNVNTGDNMALAAAAAVVVLAGAAFVISKKRK